MKLHIPLKLLAALVACVMHTSFAAGVVTIPDNATDAEVIAAKAKLATPTLTGLYQQDPTLYPQSAYQLEEVTGDVGASDFTITKYLKSATSKDLSPVEYTVEFNEAFGDASGDTNYYYKWSVDNNGNLTLVTTTDARAADIVYINDYESDNVTTSRLTTSSYSGGSIDINFVGCSTSSYGGAIYNYGGTVGDITGDFIGNYASLYSSDSTSRSYGGAIYNTGIIGDIIGDFIANYTYSSLSSSGSAYSRSHGGAIYNDGGSIGDITGDFIANYTYSSSCSSSTSRSGGAIYNTGTIIDITGDFISNYAYSYSDSSTSRSIGGAIYNDSGTIGDITGDFIGNYTHASYSSDFDSSAARSSGGAIYTYRGTIDDITGDFIGNYSYSYSDFSAFSFSSAIYNYDGTVGNITGDFISNYSYAYASSDTSASYGGAINNYGGSVDGTVGNITGDFIGNYAYAYSYSDLTASYGGAIYNDDGTVGNITGDFIANYASSYSDSSYSTSYGGAIYNDDGIVGNIIGDFIGNYAFSYTASPSFSHGGAIYNDDGTVGDITGDFIANYVSSSYSSAYGGAIYNDNGIVGNITGDFIGNYAISDSLACGGAIYNASSILLEGSINTVSGNFIGNYASSVNSLSCGGAIYNGSAHIITLLAQDDNILFNDNYADSGEAIYNKGTIYLNAYEGYEITFNDTIYNVGSSANIIIGDLDSDDYMGTIVLNEEFTGDSAAILTLASGTLVFGHYDESELATSYGNISGTQLVITGGSISTIDNTICSTSLGILTLTADTTSWSFDVDLTTESADTLTATSVSGSGSLLIGGINLIGSTDKDSITLTLTTNTDLMASISTDLSGTSFLVNGESSADYSAMSYDANTGQLTLFSTSDGTTGGGDDGDGDIGTTNLNTMVSDSGTIKQYQLSTDELTASSLGVLAGTSLSIFGEGHDITADDSDIAGITINDESQSLVISDVAEWSGFSGDAVTNNAGSLTIKASAYDSIWQNSITNGATMNVQAAEGKTVTFNEVVTGTGTLTLNDADNSGSIIFNGVLDQDSITVDGGSVSFNASVSGDLLLSAGSVSLGSAATWGDGDITLAGGVLDLGGVSLDNDIQVTANATLSDAAAYAGNLSITAGTLTVTSDLSTSLTNLGTVDASGYTLCLSGTTTGGTVIANVLKLTGNNSFSAITATSIDNGTGTLTVSSHLSTSLTNLGTVDASGYTLTLANTTTGGTVIADSLVLSGDNVFTQLTAKDVSTDGKLTIGDGSSITSLSGDTLVSSGTVTLGSDTNLASLTNSGTLNLGGHSLTLSAATSQGGTVIAGNVSLTGANSFTALSAADLTIDSSLTVSNTLTLTGDLIINTSLSTDTAILSADTLVASNGLNIVIDSDILNALDFTSSTSYELVSLDTAYVGDLTLNGATSYSLADGYSLVLATDSDGNIQLQLATSDNYWTSTDGTWGSGDTLDWTQAEPSSTVAAVFFGQGESTVTLVGEQNVGNTTINSDSQAYTFTGDQLNTSTLQVLKGGLNIANDVVVSTSASVNAAGSLAVLDGGSLTVLGALSAEDQSIANEGDLSFGENSVIGSISGAGTNTATGDATIGSLDAASSLVIEGSDTEVTLQSNTTLVSLDSEGTLNAKGYDVRLSTATTTGGTVIADNITLTGDNSFSSITATGDVSGADKLTLKGASSITGDLSAESLEITQGDVYIGSISNDLEDLSNGTGTLTLSDDLTVTNSFSNAGLILLTGKSFSLDIYSGEGGSITASSITLAEGGVFEDIITDILSLGYLGNPYLRTSSYVLTVDSIASYSGGLIELDLSDLSTSTVDATYLLIASTGDDLAWESFELSDATKTVINELIINEGKTVSYLTEDGNLSLLISDAPAADADLVWDTANELAYNADGSISMAVLVDGKVATYDALDAVSQVNVSTSIELDLTDLTPEEGQSLLISNMSGFADTALSIVGDGADEDSVTLFNDSMTVAQNAVSAKDSTIIVDNAGSDVGLNFGALELDSANLTVLDGASLRVDSIDSDYYSVISGEVTVVGDESSKLLGSYEDATLNFQTDATATIYIANADSLSLEGNGASISLVSASGNTINSFNLTDSYLSVGSITDGATFTIAEASSMTGGTLSITVDNSTIASGSTTALISGATLSLNDTTLSLSSSSYTMDISSLTSTSGIELFTLTDASDPDSSVASVELDSGALGKYFTNATYVDGTIYADLNTNSYGSLAQTNNGAVGLSMMSSVLIELNPQLDSETYEDLSMALDGLDAFKAAGYDSFADKLGAAIAGASVTSLGSAALSDINRQMDSIRNRSKNAGLANDTILSSNASAWISAEGSHSSLANDGTSAGHDLTSFGGSVGVEATVNNNWRLGAAYSFILGDVTSDAADSGDADLTTSYVSIYANMRSERWSHNFVAAFGMIDASLERTVTTNTSGDYYKTKGDTDGSSFALSYELGYSYDLNEDATSTIQPLFALSYTNSSISGYTENSSSDAALRVGDQDNSYVTVSLGVQYDTIMGAAMYNRESLLTARMMLNIDAGDRMVESDVSLVNGDGVTQTVKGTEPGAVGIEFGLGLDVPVSESSSLFMDASCEFRSEMTEISGGIGYRISF